METSEKPKPSWRKLVRTLREKSEADGQFQDGDYTDDAWLPEEIILKEEPE